MKRTMRDTIIIATMIALVLLVLASVARAASLPPGEIDWKSPDVVSGDADEIKLPPGEWCLILSVRNNPGEPRTLVYQRGTFDWCALEDRVVVKKKRKKR